MNNNAWFKKEKPLLSLQSMGGGASGTLMQGAATKNYIEELFNTYSYRGNATGTGTDNQIVNGIDNRTEGGMVWIKNRTQAVSSLVFDTLRGGQVEIKSDSQQAQQGPYTDYNIKTFNTNGFTLTGNGGNTNENNKDYVAWNFRKCSKFFDIVTYTGTGSNRTVSHNLKSTPGVVLVKNLTDAQNWVMYHRSVGNTGALLLDDAGAITTASSYWNDTSPTDAVFTVGTDNMMNGNGKSYVAYIFAHEEEAFGPDSDKKIISCGSYTGTGSAGLSVTLGFEPQWIMIKNADRAATNWAIFDSLRGLPVDGDDFTLSANSNHADGAAVNYIDPTSTGFIVQTTSHDDTNQSGDEYTYIAVAAQSGALMNPDSITAGTQVFAPLQGSGTTNCPPGTYSTNFRSDFMFWKNVSNTDVGYTASRKSGTKYVRTDHSATASTSSDYVWDSNVGMGSGLIYNSWHWRRHSGFELMSYNGNGSATAYAHNLGGVPEFMIFKNMDTGHDWMAWHKDLNGGTNAEQYFMNMNTGGAESTSTDFLNNTAPTATHVTLGAGGQANGSGDQNIGMLFRSVSGISFVSSYIGNDSASGPSIDCGFQPRLIWIKRTDNTSNWMLYDSNRGFNKCYFTNSNEAQETATRLTVTSDGFDITSAASVINNNGSRFVFYAHA